MCEYCDENATDLIVYQETRDIQLFINAGGNASALYIEADGCPDIARCGLHHVPLRGAFIINFCPNCGRKLREEDD